VPGDEAVLAVRVGIENSWQRRERALARIEPEAQAVWRAQFQALASECGCKEGMIVMAAGEAAWVLHVTTGGGYAAPWANVAFGVGVLVASATAGKLLGLALARLRGWRLLEQLEDQTATRGTNREGSFER
jgi:hypothetical protein